MTIPNLRQRQADGTRRAIVAAARSLFAQSGYAETSIAQIAAEAGVAVPTVYKSMRTKQAILMALVDLIDDEAGVGEIQRRLAEAGDARELLHGAVTLTRQMQERCGDIIGALASAAAVDPAAGAALAEGERRHRTGTAGVAKRIHATGGLREGVSAQDAAIQLSLRTSRHAYSELVSDRGWTYARAARWIERTLAADLLAIGEDAL